MSETAYYASDEPGVSSDRELWTGVAEKDGNGNWSSVPFSGDFIKKYWHTQLGPCFAHLNDQTSPADGSTIFQTWTDPVNHVDPHC